MSTVGLWLLTHLYARQYVQMRRRQSCASNCDGECWETLTDCVRTTQSLISGSAPNLPPWASKHRFSIEFSSSQYPHYTWGSLPISKNTCSSTLETKPSMEEKSLINRQKVLAVWSQPPRFELDIQALLRSRGMLKSMSLRLGPLVYGGHCPPV